MFFSVGMQAHGFLFIYFNFFAAVQRAPAWCREMILNNYHEASWLMIDASTLLNNCGIFVLLDDAIF